MDRRKFLLGSAGVDALGGLGKLAPAPVWESPPMVAEIGLTDVMSLRPGHIMWDSNPHKVSWVEDRFHIESIPLEDFYA